MRGCSPLLSLGEGDGQLWVQEDVGSDGRVGGCKKADWAIREWQIASVQTCWGVISPEN